MSIFLHKGKSLQGVLITGSTGFVGSRLVQYLNGHKFDLILPKGFRVSPETDWSEWLQGCGTVVHLAARVHQLNDSAQSPLAAYREVNVDATRTLLRQSEQAGVKRFIFISTIKVLGESTLYDEPFSDSSVPNPQDPYAISKYEAELCVQQSQMDFVNLRIPLVYGAGVKANLLRLMRWVDGALPLPFAAIHNRRSLLGLDNLCDAIRCLIDHPHPIRQTFVLADSLGVSLPMLMSEIANAMGKKSRLWSLPPTALQHTANFLGFGHIAERLFQSLSVDARNFCAALAWSAPYSFDRGVQFMVNDYLNTKQGALCL